MGGRILADMVVDAGLACDGEYKQSHGVREGGTDESGGDGVNREMKGKREAQVYPGMKRNKVVGGGIIGDHQSF